MIEDYKKFLKENKELFYMLFSFGAFATIFIVFICSFIAVASNIDRNYSNNKKLSVYRENLATFQKCAEKIQDTSLIRSYCGDAPSEPILIW
jgi:hypothetical protein